MLCLIVSLLSALFNLGNISGSRLVKCWLSLSTFGQQDYMLGTFGAIQWSMSMSWYILTIIKL